MPFLSIILKGQGHAQTGPFFSPAGWKTDMMAGAPAAVLDHEVGTKTTFTGAQGRSPSPAHNTRPALLMVEHLLSRESNSHFSQSNLKPY